MLFPSPIPNVCWLLCSWLGHYLWQHVTVFSCMHLFVCDSFFRPDPLPCGLASLLWSFLSPSFLDGVFPGFLQLQITKVEVKITLRLKLTLRITVKLLLTKTYAAMHDRLYLFTTTYYLYLYLYFNIPPFCFLGPFLLY